MDFTTRFAKLNDNQKQAVKQIFGSLLVIAGPGTGKTELLSMRTAQILRETDTLPSSILCLTFTESGAVNMRERLRSIIGEAAYKVAIHTFHSFGVEIISQHREYFFRGSEFTPADELTQHRIVRQLFDSLPWDHPLATKNGDDFVYASDAMTIISEFKKSGLTGEELRRIIQHNQQVIDIVSPHIAEVFADKITKQTIEKFARLAEIVTDITTEKLPAGISSYAGTLALSIAHAAQEAIDTGKTNAITAWKNAWCEKDETKITVFKDARHTEKLLMTTELYDAYESAMHDAKLYDYDDMILSVIAAVETHADLRANVQEKFQFIMVDEFQDTNLAQLRLLFSLTDGESPNIMAVGDDDQAIFSFQGADIGNIQRFRERFNNPPIIVLTDNYRSDSIVLTAARTVITQGTDRLEYTIANLSKELTPWFSDAHATVSLDEYASPGDERTAVARQIAQLIKQGVSADKIAVLARRHYELVDLLPYLAHENILVNYERRDNVLDHEIILLLELLSRVIMHIKNSEHDRANALLPELIAHPGFGFTPQDIWKLSLAAWRNRSLWLETMQTMPIFQPFAHWLIAQTITVDTQPLEQHIDTLLGIEQADESSDDFTSPLKNYFFSPEQLTQIPDVYLTTLEALRTLRDQLREYFSDVTVPTLAHFLEFIDLHRQLGTGITAVRHRADHQQGLVNLMTAHKAKGLEFDHVFIIGATDNSWGEKVRARSRLIRYPANLPLQPAGNTYDERLRLFFVAMTRAKKTLHISYPISDTSGKSTLVASFLSAEQPTLHSAASDILTLTTAAELSWHSRLHTPISADLRTLLTPTLEQYKLSATHLGHFLDVSHGGPRAFLLNNLLRFPQAKSASASYGTAIHAALQQAHNSVRTDGTLPSFDIILDNFSQLLLDQHLTADDYAMFNDRGRSALTAFLESHSSTFTTSQLTELNFAGQGVVVNEARLTGTLDLADIDKTAKTIRVTDYKTGRPSRSWHGKTDYEKIKLHKYRQQLMFYQLLVEYSRDYSGYTFTGGVLQFVEPEPKTGDILALEDRFTKEDMEHFTRLITIVWQKITNLDLPDTSVYEPNYKGMLQFERDLLDIS